MVEARMFRAWHKSLYARLLLGVVALVGLVALPFGLLAFSKLRSAQEQLHIERVKRVATQLAGEIRDASSSGQLDVVQRAVERLAEAEDVDSLFVVDAAGTITAHSDRSKVSTFYNAESYLPDHFDFERRLEEANQTTVVSAHAGIIRERLDDELSPFKWTLAAVFIFGLLAGAALAYLLAAHISRPMGRMAQAAKEILDGNLDLELQGIEDPVEVGRVARSFEEMRKALHDHVVRLEKSHAELDRRLRHLTILHSVGEALRKGLSGVELLELVLGSALQGVGSSTGVVILRDRLTQRIVGERKDSSNGINRDSWRLLVNAVVEETLETGEQTELSGDEVDLSQVEELDASASAPLHGRQPSGAEMELLRSIHLAGTPLNLGSDTTGVIVVMKRGQRFSVDEIGLLRELAKLTGDQS